jgi:hypothetical protein
VISSVRYRTEQQVRIATINADDPHTDEPVTTVAAQVARRHGARVPSTIHSGGPAREEELLQQINNSSVNSVDVQLHLSERDEVCKRQP